MPNEEIDGLAERANEGLLSDDERAEYEALINAADFISIHKLKARQQQKGALDPGAGQPSAR